MTIAVVGGLWIGWCALHSIMIDAAVTNFVKIRLPAWVRWYRLLYNGLSLVTLIPLATYTGRIGGEVIFAWQGWGGTSVRMLILTLSGLLFWGGAKRYDFKTFLGIRQLRAGETGILLSESRDFAPTGVFAMTRHPWYLGSLLAIWTIFPEYQLGPTVAVIILSLYLVLGTLLEERKIVQEHGDSYRLYQQQVSMLVPWKWLKNRMKW